MQSTMRLTTRVLRNISMRAECQCQSAVSPWLQRRWNSTQAEAEEAAGPAEASNATPAESTSAVAQTPSYPFSSSVIFGTQGIAPKQKDQPYSLMDRTNQALLLSTTESFRGLFRKGSPTRIPPGSIISVETLSGGATPATCNSTSVFAGVLLQVKRRHFGVDDSFTVRASVGKPGTGTEVRYDVNSPWIKNIKVLQRNDKYRRAKIYYIRRSEKFLSGVQSAIRASQTQTDDKKRPSQPNAKKGKKSKK